MKNKIILLTISLVFFLVLTISVHALPADEYEYYDWVYKNTTNLSINAVEDYHCAWDNSSSTNKTCNPIIEIKNVGSDAIQITNINFVSDDIKLTPDYLISTADSNLMNVSRTNWSCVNYSQGKYEKDCKIKIQRINWGTFGSFGSSATINPGNTIAIKLNFTLPLYDGGHYNFTLETNISFDTIILDPNISSCQTITSADTYTVTHDLSDTQTCLIIESDNVTIDGNDYDLEYGTGTDGYFGIDAENRKNITIYGFHQIHKDNGYRGAGINLANGSYNYIHDNEISEGGSGSGDEQSSIIVGNYSNITFNTLLNGGGIFIQGKNNNISSNYLDGDSLVNNELFIQSGSNNNILYNNTGGAVLEIEGINNTVNGDSHSSITNYYGLDYFTGSNNTINNTNFSLTTTTYVHILLRNASNYLFNHCKFYCNALNNLDCFNIENSSNISFTYSNFTVPSMSGSTLSIINSSNITMFDGYMNRPSTETGILCTNCTMDLINITGNTTSVVQNNEGAQFSFGRFNPKCSMAFNDTTKLYWQTTPSYNISFPSYPNGYEMVRAEITWRGTALSQDYNITFKWYNRDTGKSIFNLTETALTGWTSFWYRSWVGNDIGIEINQTGNYYVNISGQGLFTDKIINFTVVSGAGTDLIDTNHINKWWYVDEYVNDSSGNPVNAATVNVTDGWTLPVFNKTTNSSGYIVWSSKQNILKEYVQVPNTIYLQSPYKFNGSKSGLGQATTYRTVNQSYIIPNPVFMTLGFSPGTVTFVSPTPVNNTGVSENFVYVNATVTGTNLDHCQLWFGGGTIDLNITDNICGYNVTGLADGGYYYNMSVYDVWENYNKTETRIIWVGVGASPQVNFTAPTIANNTWQNWNWTYTNFTANSSDANIDVCLEQVNGAYYSANLVGWGKFVSCNLNLTNLSDGDYIIEGWANTTRSAWGYTENRTFHIDTVKPAPIFVSPTLANGSSTQNSYYYINVTVLEWNLNATGCQVRVDNINKTTTTVLNETSGVNNCYANVTGLSNGWHTYNLTARDKANNINSTETWWIYTGASNPIVTFVSPTPSNNSFINKNYFYVNATATTTSGTIDVCLEYLDNGTGVYYSANKVGSGSSVSCNLNNTGLLDGVYLYSMWANNSLSYWGNTLNQTITIDTVKPLISFVSPTPANNSVVTDNWVYINASVSDSYLNKCIINWNGTNQTLTISNNACGINKTLLARGIYNYRMWVNDSAGNYNSTGLQFVDVRPVDPVVTLISPANGTISNNLTQTFKCNATTAYNLSNITLYIWNATNNIVHSSTTSNETLNETYALPLEGDYHWNCLAYDNVSSNWAVDNYTLTINISTIIVNIINPKNNIYPTTVPIDFTVQSINPVDSCWYSLDGGTNTTLVGCANTTFSTTLGNHNLTLYINDSTENLAYDFALFSVSYSNITESDVLETTRKSYDLTLTLNDTNLAAISTLFVYKNETYYVLPNVTQRVGFVDVIANKSIFIPLVDDGVGDSQNISFYWNYTLYYSNGTVITFQTNLLNQTVHKLIVTNCNGTYPIRTVNITQFRDEITDVQIYNVSLSSVWNLYVSDPSFYRLYNYTIETLDYKEYCISPEWASFYADTRFDYFKGTDPNSTYYLRNYYFDKNNLSNVTQNYTFYLGEIQNTTRFFVTVRDITQNILPGAIVEFKKYFIGDNVYRTTDMKKTDDNGQTAIRLFEENWYHIVVHKNGTILKTIELYPKCQVLPCEFEINLAEVTNPFEALQDLPGVTYAFQYDKNTSIEKVGYTDENGLVALATLEVYQKQYDSEDILICSQSSNLSAFTLQCNLSNYTSASINDEFTAKFTIIRTDGTSSIRYDNIKTSSVAQTLGIEMVFWAALLVLALFFIGIWNPIVALCMAGIGIFFFAYFGLIALSITSIIMLIVVIGIYIYKSRT